MPVYDNKSRILILGSFPSVKSRENEFYYGHPKNRFWKVIASVLGEDVPLSVEDKKKLLLSNNIALWDVVDSCDIILSSDCSITNVVPNDILSIVKSSCIKEIYTNGKTAYRLYEKLCYPAVKIKAVPLLSTSPANAAYSLQNLISDWSRKMKQS